MSGIAQKFGVSLNALLQANPQISDPNVIYAGQVLTIPTQGEGTATPQEPAQKEYTVQKGDSLSAIAQRFGVSLQAIVQANPDITNPNVIYVGQRINIPTSGSTGSSTKPQTQKYTVKSRDTLSGIAQDFGISLQALRQANPQITDPNVIYPGQVLTIPKA